MQKKLLNVLIILVFFLGLMSCSEKKETKQEQNRQITVSKQESSEAALKSERDNEDEEDNYEADDEEKDEENEDEDEIDDEQESSDENSDENKDEEEDSFSTEEEKGEMKKGDLTVLGTIDSFGNLVTEDGKIYDIAENENKEKLINMVDRKVELKGSITEKEGYTIIIVDKFKEIE